VTDPAYATPAAFKQALAQRLRNASSFERVDLARRRQLLVFERFLARVFAQLGERVWLKGGLVLELRLKRARTTKDVDLRCIGEPERIVEELRAAGRLQLGDFMTFELAPHAHHPTIQNGGMKYDGLRLRAECRLAAKVYGQPFGVDVAFGDPLISVPDAPAEWTPVYAMLAREAQLPWASLGEVQRVVRAFLNPILAGSENATWSPQSWSRSKEK
jgi:hypothetical protein